VIPARSYYMLVSSLPQLPARFDAGRLPISWPTLRNRLRMLEHDDGRITRQVGLYFLWDRQPLDRTDEEVIERYHELMRNMTNHLVRHLVRSRTEMRLIISCIRRRAAGLGPPNWIDRVANPDSSLSHLRKHWLDPNFNLGVRFRWAEAFRNALEAGDMREAQRAVFNERWDDWTHIAEKQTFAFEAIIAYLVRWEIIDRWTSQNVDAGKTRFNQLIEETLGEYANPFQ
jgi:hypothetical protein